MGDLRQALATDTRECGSCHGLNTYLSRKPNFSASISAASAAHVVTNLTWDLIKRLARHGQGQAGAQRLLAFEDAKLAADAGIDAIVVSTMRRWKTRQPTIDVLPEIVGAVGGRMPILVDAAFAAAATSSRHWHWARKPSVIGRPHLWGLGAFGQPGRARACHPPAETRNAMAQLGAPSLRDLAPAMCGGSRAGL